ncbi:MAG: helix-turn-helix domain-containing protein [Xanthobacteraceae bacterium]
MTLLTVHEAAERLGVSEKTLRGHIRSGRLGYINVGLGDNRKSYRIAESAIDAFQRENEHREASPCQSIGRRTPRSISTTFSSEAIGFTALREKRAGEKPRRQSV